MVSDNEPVKQFENYFTKKGIQFEQGKSEGLSFVAAKLTDIEKKANVRSVQSMISRGKFTCIKSKDGIWSISGGKDKAKPSPQKKAKAKPKKGAAKKAAPKASISETPSDATDMPEAPKEELLSTHVNQSRIAEMADVLKSAKFVVSRRGIKNGIFTFIIGGTPNIIDLKQLCFEHDLKFKMIRDKQANVVTVMGSATGGLF